MSCKSVFPKCPPRVSHKSVFQESHTRVALKSVFPKAPSKSGVPMSLPSYVNLNKKSASLVYLILLGTCLHSGSWASSCFFAAGHVTKPHFSNPAAFGIRGRMDCLGLAGGFVRRLFKKKPRWGTRFWGTGF